MGSPGQIAAKNPGDLGQFLHQGFLGLETTGCIDQRHVGIFGDGRFDGVEGHRCGISPGLPRDDRAIDPLAPNLELVDGRRPESISGSQNHLLSFRDIAGGEFPDGGGLSRTVHAEHQHHVGPRRSLHRLPGFFHAHEFLQNRVP